MADLDACFLCNNICVVDSRGDSSIYLCKNCGYYRVAGSFEACSIEKNLKPKIAYWVRQQYPAKVDWDTLKYQLDSLPFVQFVRGTQDFFREIQLPSPAEQFDKLIEYLAENQISFGEGLNFEYFKVIPWTGASVNGDIYALLLEMASKGLIISDRGVGSESALAKLTLAGYQYYESIKRRPSKDLTAFLAMSFGNEEDGSFQRGERFYQHLKEKISVTGFNLERVDTRKEPKCIKEKVFNDIRKCHLMIADITDLNPNVMLEVGYALGLPRPVFLIADANRFPPPRPDGRPASAPFDIYTHQRFAYQAKNEDGIPDEQTIQNLIATICFNLPGARQQPVG